LRDRDTVQPAAARGAGNALARSAGAARPGAFSHLKAPIVWGLPLLVWQCVFFVVPLGLLVAMTFWSVRNFRLSPDLTFRNWNHLFGESYFYVTYFRTLAYSVIASAVGSALAFPCSYVLAYKVRPSTRRLVTFLLITPFFTSYLVRAYSWQIILSDNGLINSLLNSVGLGRVPMLNTPIATIIGYLTLFFPLIILLQLIGLSGVDRDLINAAYNLGANPLRTIVKVIVPSAKVGLILAATFAFIFAFGDFVSPAQLGGGKAPTLSILIIDTVKSASNWPMASAIALTMIVTLVAVMFSALGLAYGPRRTSRHG
jgi:spermidine/putrescine transport system permease protein